MDYKKLLATLYYCQSQSVKGCGGCPGEAECCNSGDFLEKESAKAIERLLAERDAAVKVLQRFSYCNERKCRWCKFSKPAVMGPVICDHPALRARYKQITDALPFYPNCTRFEYEYKEENAK